MTSDLDNYRLPDKAPEPPKESSRKEVARLATPSDLTVESGLPANIDAERTLLGAVLLDNEAFSEIREKLGPDDFSLDSHRRIALRMSQLIKRGNAVDIVTLANELNRNKEVEAIGGVSYLASLTEGLPRRPVIEEYIRIVKDKSLLRRLMLICSAAIARAADQSETALEVIGAVESQLEQATSQVEKVKAGPIINFIATAMGQDAEEYAQRTPRHVPSGVPWFDQKTGGGYRMGKITLVCARPNVGKTPFAIQSVATNCARGNRAVFFAFETEKEEVLRSLIPYVVDVPNKIANTPELRTPEQHKLVQSAYCTLLDDWENLLSIYDEEMDIDEICWTIDKECRGDKSDTLIVIDHFGLIAGGNKNMLDRENENSGRLRAKIKKKRAALVSLMQFRKARNREESNKVPTRDDVKGAGRIFEDAFACLILHREINEETRKMSTNVLMDLCKLRTGGSIGSTMGKFDTRRLSFLAEPELEEDRRDWYS